MLKEILHFVAERRKVAVEVVEAGEGNPGDYFYQYRPPSMMNCPPNYYLNTVSYTTTKVVTGEPDDAKVITGIESLKCLPHEAAKNEHTDKIPDVLEVKLQASTAHVGYKVPLPNVGVPGFQYPYEGGSYYAWYSLTQYIGQPGLDSSITSNGYTECEEEGVAFGMLLRRNSNDEINFFKLLCLPAPAKGSTP